MKRLGLIPLFLSGFLLFGVPVSHAQEKIVITGIEDSLVVENVVREILKEAYQRIGIEYVHFPATAARALSLAHRGEVDGASTRVSEMMQKYPTLKKIPIPVYTFRAVLFSKDPGIKPSLDGIRNLRVGIRRGNKLIETLTRYQKTEKAVNAEELFKMLTLNQIDVVIIDKIDGMAVLRALREKYDEKYTDIHLLPGSLIEIPLFHFLHDKNEHLVPEVTRTMREMEKEGFIERLYEDFESVYLKY